MRCRMTKAAFIAPKLDNNGAVTTTYRLMSVPYNMSCLERAKEN